MRFLGELMDSRTELNDTGSLLVIDVTAEPGKKTRARGRGGKCQLADCFTRRRGFR